MRESIESIIDQTTVETTRLAEDCERVILERLAASMTAEPGSAA